MPIGTSKIGVLGGKIPVPAGSQTFNSPGTFTAVTGLKKVTITGKGGAGTGGCAGNPGNPGAGGGGGYGGDASQVFWYPPYYDCCGNPQPGYYIGYGSNYSNSTSGGSAYPNNYAAGPSGNAGSGGGSGSAGSASTGLCKTFPGGNAGNPGTAGNGGSGGNKGGTGGSVTFACGGPYGGFHKCGYAGAGGNGGGSGGVGTTPGYPTYTSGPGGVLQWSGAGGGGAGACNSGNAGIGACYHFVGPNSGYTYTRCGGNGGTGPTGSGGHGGNGFYQSFPPTTITVNPGGHSNCIRGGGGGGFGATISSGNAYAAGGGGGGRGNVGNAGAAGGAGNAGTPTAYPCVSVTPGASYPIVVGSGGQVNISWNTQ